MKTLAVAEPLFRQLSTPGARGLREHAPGRVVAVTQRKRYLPPQKGRSVAVQSA